MALDSTIGSSENNTVMELIIGHHGLKRLGLAAVLSAQGAGTGPAGRPPEGGARSPGAQAGPGRPPDLGGSRPAPPGPGGGFSEEVGQPGWLRLVTEPLVGEAGWLLPVALLGVPLTLLVILVAALSFLGPTADPGFAVWALVGLVFPLGGEVALMFKSNPASMGGHLLIALSPSYFG